MPFVLSGTTASTTGANASISFPTGYTGENCCVGGFSVKNKNNSTWYSNVNAVTVYLSTGVQIQVSDAVWTSMPIKVWLIPL